MDWAKERVGVRETAALELPRQGFGTEPVHADVAVIGVFPCFLAKKFDNRTLSGKTGLR
jgi:hypothetical protein